MTTTTERQRWMGLLSRAPIASLERAMRSLGSLPAHERLRPPEIGLVMVRGRAGGNGQPFNVGEMTMTRCVVRIALDGEAPCVGFGYVAGRSKRHAELAAVADALLQSPRWRERITDAVLAPLEAEEHELRRQRWRETAATEVKFLSVVRGG